MDDVIKLFNTKFKFITTESKSISSNNNNNKNNNDINLYKQLIETISKSLSNNINNNNYKSTEIIELFQLIKLLPFKDNEELEDNEDDEDEDYIYNKIRNKSIELIFKILPIVLKEAKFQYDSSLMSTLFSISCDVDQLNSPLQLLVLNNTINLFNNFKIIENSSFFIKNCLLPYIHDIFHYILSTLKNNNNNLIKFKILNLLEIILKIKEFIEYKQVLTKYISSLFKLLYENIKIQADDNSIYNIVLDENNLKFKIRKKCGKILKLLSNSNNNNNNDNYLNYLLNNLIYYYDGDDGSGSGSEGINSKIFKNEALIYCLNSFEISGSTSISSSEIILPNYFNEESLLIILEFYFNNKFNNKPIEWIYMSTILNNLSIYYKQQPQLQSQSTLISFYQKINELILIENPIFQISILNFIKNNNLPIIDNNIIIKITLIILPNLKYKLQFKSYKSLFENLIVTNNISLEFIEIIYNNFQNCNLLEIKFEYLKLFKLIIIAINSNNNNYNNNTISIEIYYKIFLELELLLNKFEDFMESIYIQPIIKCLEFLNEFINLSNSNNRINNILIKSLNIIKPDEIIYKSLLLFSNKLAVSSNSTSTELLELNQLNQLLLIIYKFLIDFNRNLINQQSFILLNNLINSNNSINIQPYINELLIQIINRIKLQDETNDEFKRIIIITFNKLLLNCNDYSFGNVLKIYSNFLQLFSNQDFENSVFSGSGINGDNEGDGDTQSFILILDLFWNDNKLINFNSNQALNLKLILIKWLNNNNNNNNQNLKLKLKYIYNNSIQYNIKSPIVLEKLKKLINSDFSFLN